MPFPLYPPPSFSLSSLSLFPLFFYPSCLCICLCVSLPVSPFFLSLLLTSLIPLSPPSPTSLSTYLHVSPLSLSLSLPQGLIMLGKYFLFFSPDQAPVTDFSVSPINFSDWVQVLGTGKCGPSLPLSSALPGWFWASGSFALLTGFSDWHIGVCEGGSWILEGIMTNP